MRKKPSDEQLNFLYEAAAAFKNEKQWQEFYDTDLIGFENPATGEMGFCSILGSQGNVSDLDVCLGGRGLAGFVDFMEEDLPAYEIFEWKNSLTCTFVDKQDLEKADWERCRCLGLSFRGKNAWLEFRRYEPGFIPPAG